MRPDYVRNLLTDNSYNDAHQRTYSSEFMKYIIQLYIIYMSIDILLFLVLFYRANKKIRNTSFIYYVYNLKIMCSINNKINMKN